MALPKRPLQVRFLSADQKSADKYLIGGRLTLAENVYQPEPGRYRKRPGFASYAKTADSGSISAGYDVTSTGDAQVIRTGDSIYAYSSGLAKWFNRGSISQIAIDHRTLIGAGTFIAQMSSTVLVSGLLYTFAWDTNTATGPFIWYTVTEAATGIELQAPTKVDSVRYNKFRAVVFGGFVWLYAGPDPSGSTRSIYTFKFDPSTPTVTPSRVTYVAPSAGSWENWDVMADGNGVWFAGESAATVTIGGVAQQGWLSQLDTATGAVKAAPGNVAFSATLNKNFAWMSWDGSDGKSYIVSWNAGTQLARISTVTQSTLAQTHADVSGSTMATGATNYFAVSGYYDGTNKVIFVTGDLNSIENAVTQKHIVAGATTNNTNWHRAAIPASDPFKVGSTWYLLLQHDDNQAVPLQPGYYLVDVSSGLHVGRALYQFGGNALMRAGSPSGAISSGGTFNAGFTLRPQASGNKVYLGAQKYETGLGYVNELLTWDFAPSFGPPVPTLDGQEIVFPGAWPLQLPQEATLSEVSPAMYPRAHATIGTSAGSLPTGTYQVLFTYAFRDKAGNYHRSSVSATGSASSGGASKIDLTIPTLRYVNNNTGYMVEVWSTLAGGSTFYRNGSIANDPTVDTVSYSITSVSTAGEPLYTTGNILDNVPPPPFRVAATWRNRVFVTDTDVLGEVWFTQQFRAGRGLEFNELLAIVLRGGTGRVRAAGVVDDNYLAFFKADAVHLIGGPGPDRTGRGNYTSIQLPGNVGTTNARSIATGPAGCFFQGNDGGIWLVPRDATAPAFVGKGVWAYRTDSVTGTAVLPKLGLIVFATSGSRLWVLDYQNPTDDQPYGQWYTWTSPAAVSLAVQSDVLQSLASDGTVSYQVPAQWFDGTNTPILEKVTMAPLSPAGVGGELRLHRGVFVGTFLGNHTIRVTMSNDYGSGPSKQLSKAMTASPEKLQFTADTQRMSALTLTFEQTGSDLTEGFIFEGVDLEVAIRTGVGRIPTGQRM